MICHIITTSTHSSIPTSLQYIEWKQDFIPFACFIHSFKSRMENHTEIPVYNYIYDKNNLTWGSYMNFVRKGLHEPLNKAVW